MKISSKEPQRKPNFLVVGTTKSGTTSIHNYLREHFDIYMPVVKEPRFFICDVIRHLNSSDPRSLFLQDSTVFKYDDYMHLFEKATEEKAVGETSPQYLYYYKSAIPKIKYHLGDVKIIIILRNPIYRAFSSYQHLRRDGYETLSFRDALDKESERRQLGWSHSYYYLDVGFYYRQVQEFLNNFTNVKVFLFDELVSNPISFIQSMYDFLEIDASYSPNIKAHYNVSGIPKNQFLHNIIHRPNFLRQIVRPYIKKIVPGKTIAVWRSYLTDKNLKKLKIDQESFQIMAKIYSEDIRKLQNTLGRDLSFWLNQ